MPDVHAGKGATVGTVLALRGAGRRMSAEVMARQDDLVEIVHELRQVVCVKG